MRRDAARVACAAPIGWDALECASLRRMSLTPLLDFLRANFAYFVAVALPLAGVVLAIAKFAAGDRDEGLRIAAAALLGVCLYALAFW